MMVEHELKIPTGEATLNGCLNVPQEARGVVLFVHGSGQQPAQFAIASLPRRCTKRGWRRCCSTFSLPRKRPWILTRVSIASTSTCSPTASGLRPSGSCRSPLCRV
jgi:hypothetical protein